MKRKALVLFVFLLISSSTLLSQPTTITWQGKLLDAGGNAISQNNVAMTFAMFDTETAGNQLWPASGVVAKVVNVVNGLYSVQLGTGIGDDLAFTAAMFDGKTPWLEVKVGTETLPRTEITNVPFALISNELSDSGWENPGEIGKTTPNTGKFTTLGTGSVKITTGAGDGKVLKSDTDGNASWEAVSGLESDPVFGSSLASSISGADTTRWGTTYWKKDGSNIYFPTGKVGIGSSDPATLNTAPLNVEGGIRYAGGLDGTGVPGQLYYNSADTGTFMYVDNLGRHKVFGAGSINYSGTLWSLNNFDLYTNRDVICGYSLGVGFDMTPGTAFGFATIMMRENNLRILFDDTSIDPFPNTDWQLTANSSTSGGEEYFSIDDVTNSTTPFKVMSQAPSNALFVSSSGRLGIGTASPVQYIHINDDDTPAVRFEQNTTGIYPAYSWEAGGNEVQFFIRDVTGGSTMPFRIKPGSPANSLTISDNGNVGIGTWTPQQKIHIMGIMRLEPVDEPATAGEGDIYYDKNTHKARCYDGTIWHDLW